MYINTSSVNHKAKLNKLQRISSARCQWLTPVILATWEAEIRRITVQSHSKQIVHKTPVSKTTRAKWTGGVTQAIEDLFCKHSPEFKSQSHQKKKEKNFDPSPTRKKFWFTKQV
jgi:hypothetical protein